MDNKELSKYNQNDNYQSQVIQVNRDPFQVDFLDDNQSPVHEFFRLVMVNRWLIALVSLLIFITVSTYSLLATNMYSATSIINIGTYVNPMNTAYSMTAQNQQADSTYVLNYITDLENLATADKVLTDPTIYNKINSYLKKRPGTLEFIKSAIFIPSSSDSEENIKNTDNLEIGYSYHFPENFLKKYYGLISVSPIRRTTRVSVTATTSDKNLSAEIANAHAKAFIERISEQRKDASRKSQEDITNLINEKAKLVELKERELAIYAEENAIVSLNKDENLINRRLSELNKLLTDSQASRIKSETAFTEIRDSKDASTIIDDASIQSLRISLKEAMAKKDELLEQYTPEWPEVKHISAKIASLKKQIDEQRKQALNTLESRYKSDLETENKLKEELSIQESKKFELDRKIVDYNRMKREYEVAKTSHENLLNAHSIKQLESESDTSNISIASYATIPLSPSSPKRARNILIALFAGPAIGILLAHLLNMLDNTVKLEEDIPRLFNLPSLGHIPTFNESNTNNEGKRSSILGNLSWTKQDNQEEDEKEVLKNASTILATNNSTFLPVVDNTNSEFITISSPRSVAAESFRNIRTRILLSSADHPPKIMLVTSAKKSEGKTTFISNFSVTLAQNGKKTLVIDMDLRRPRIHSLFPIEQEAKGIANYLTGQCKLSEAIRSCAVPDLYIMPCGARPPNPAELINSQKMKDLVNTLSKEYDYILIDAPPVLPVSDAMIASKMTDGVILVVKAMDTQKQVAGMAITRLQQVGAKILGVVLNDVNTTSGNYYYYYRDTYGYYYGDSKKK